MKAKNTNSSSIKTKGIIKKIFAEMLCEKREVGKISVTELCARANICRGAFYAHYDDIYGVAEDYENELIDTFFNKIRLLSSYSINEFIDSIFEYIHQNDENYRLLCKSNDFFFAAKKLAEIASKKILELCKKDSRIKKTECLELDIKIFIEGLFCEYVRYCRGYSQVKIEDLYDYTKYWVEHFIDSRS